MLSLIATWEGVYPRHVRMCPYCCRQPWGGEIHAVADKSENEYIFWDGQQDIVKSWTKYVIAPLFAAAKIVDAVSMKSHLLRDTFAMDLLEKGVQFEEPSKLRGHKPIKTTEKSYAKWVRGRQDSVDALLIDTWASTSRV